MSDRSAAAALAGSRGISGGGVGRGAAGDWLRFLHADRRGRELRRGRSWFRRRTGAGMSVRLVAASVVRRGSGGHAAGWSAAVRGLGGSGFRALLAGTASVSAADGGGDE